MFAPEKVLKILQLSAQYYQTNSSEKQNEITNQVLALTTLPPTPVDHDGPPKMKLIDPSAAEKENNRKPRSTWRPTHPPMASLINEAILTLHERGGSSLQAIKKFIHQSYNLDTGKLARYIRKYLREAVDHGILLHPKGKGATGHFKLAKKPPRAAASVVSSIAGRGPQFSPALKVTKKPHPKSTGVKTTIKKRAIKKQKTAVAGGGKKGKSVKKVVAAR